MYVLYECMGGGGLIWGLGCCERRVEAFTGGLKIMEVGRDGGVEAAVEPAPL